MPKDQMYAGAGEDQEQGDQTDQGQEQSDENTALLDKSVFGDNPPEPGETCTFKVVKVYDKDVEVEYQKSGKSSKKPSSMDDADSKMESMAMENSGGAYQPGQE